MDKEQLSEAAQKIVAAFRKMEVEQGFREHWGYLDENNNVVRCHMSVLLERCKGQDPMGPMGPSRRVAYDVVCRSVTVSTVFLGLEHGFGPYSEWFETMVFGGLYDQYAWRYATYNQAKDGHARVLMMVENWARWLGYSRAHLRKIRREYESRGKVLGREEGVFID